MELDFDGGGDIRRSFSGSSVASGISKFRLFLCLPDGFLEGSTPHLDEFFGLENVQGLRKGCVLSRRIWQKLTESIKVVGVESLVGLVKDFSVSDEASSWGPSSESGDASKELLQAWGGLDIECAVPISIMAAFDSRLFWRRAFRLEDSQGKFMSGKFTQGCSLVLGSMASQALVHRRA